MRIGHMIVFLSMFAAILVLSHFYLFTRISHYLNLGDGGRRSLALLLGLFGILTLVSLPLGRILPREAAAILEWVVFPWMGFLLLMLVVMITTDLVWIITNLLSTSVHDPARRTALQKTFGIAALGATGLLGGFSLWKGTRDAAVKNLTVTLSRLPKSFDGLRIVQITDLHIGAMIGGDWLQGVVDQVNALSPDIIAITGDLVDGSVAELQKHVAPLAGLKAPRGIYFITGNHEYYSGVEEWCAHVAGLGIKVLRNERVAITGADGSSFDLAGVDDWASRQFPGQGADLPKALAGRDQDKALILLAHQPAAVIEAAQHGVDLQLSGHTHGGQIWPFTYLVYLQQPYAEGLHRREGTGTQIYVSPGTGFWGPPMRLGTTAEITHITLRCA